MARRSGKDAGAAARARNAFVAGTALTAVAGCGGGGASPATAEQFDARTEDLAIARAVYGLDPATPPGFYTEASPYPDRQTLTVHVKSSDLGGAPNSAYEVCSDDFTEALAWSAENARMQGLQTTLTGNSDTEWYFQFDREVGAAEPAMLLNRVFRCAKIDRSTLATDGSQGTINERPVSAGDLRWLVEYLWGFSPSNNALNAVIESSGSSSADALHHTIVRAEARRYAGSGDCDVIDLYSIDYAVDRNDGSIAKTESWLRSFEARFASGIAALCDDG